MTCVTEESFLQAGENINLAEYILRNLDMFLEQS